MKFDFSKYISTDDFLALFSKCVYCHSKCEMDKENFTFRCNKCEWSVGLVAASGIAYQTSLNYYPVPRNVEAAFLINRKMVISIEMNNLILNKRENTDTNILEKKIIFKSNPIDLDEALIIVNKYRALL